jgi:hypothetical protein
MIAYKLVKIRKDGSIGPLFINVKQRIPFGEWLEAEDHLNPKFAHRPGWHCCFKMVAPHLKMMDNRVWVKCEVEDYTTYPRPESQGGSWILANKIKFLEIIRE